ncbi:MAG TPA: energy transducer TonB, partial [Magnetospirillum sp.]|nr:energy transducer TonB [Magnetospirillum sp.]
TGLTRLRFILDQQGDLISVEVAESSGNSALDRAALAAVRRAAPFPQPPNTMPASALNFEIPFRFR